ncbi:MAG: hypothetical protein GQ542_16690 [Desulforhopalus sp.]|nr:hypothetical protein [Desulforhopalus sp.]
MFPFTGVRILRHQSGWVEVHHESGLTGWISLNLLWGWLFHLLSVSVMTI